MPNKPCSECDALREEMRAFLEVAWKQIVSTQELTSDLRRIVDRYRPFLGDVRDKKY